MNRISPPVSRARAIAFTLAMGALGAALNLVPLQLGLGVTLVLGNFAYLVVAAWLGPRLALACAMLVTLPFLWQWGHVGGLIMFGAEALFVGVLCRRGVRPFYADVLYWAVIGMPLYALIVRVLATAPMDYALALCVKNAVNGLMIGSFASLLVLAVGSRGFTWLRQVDNLARHDLRSRLVYVMTVTTAFVLVTTTLLATSSTVRYQESLVRARLDETAAQLGRSTEEYLAAHRSAVSLLADLLSHSSDRAALLQPMLLEEHRHFPGFVSMVAADAEGNIVAAAPLERLEAARAGVFPSIADRDYFREAVARDGVHESNAFLGRGLWTQPVIAISQRYSDGPGGSALGVVAGSLDLHELARVLAPPRAGSVSVLLVDREGRVIHASPELGFAALQPLESYRGPAPDPRRDVLSFAVDGRAIEYLRGSRQLANGWHVYALMEYRALIAELMLQYSGIFLLMVTAIGIAAWLAQRSGRRIARPLEQLARELAEAPAPGVARIGALRPEASSEIALVHEALTRSLAQIERHHGELEQQVALRTSELEQANAQLAEQARVDALTGIENRRGLAERFPVLRAAARRSGSRLAVVIVDLDHFKRLNDTHGHLAGDRCLVEVARMLHESFARGTDLVARFGGEEFVIALECDGMPTLTRRLEALRERIATTKIAAGGPLALEITASFGAVVAGAEYSILLAEWLSAADRCLYQAKSEGRNRVVSQELSVRETRCEPD